MARFKIYDLSDAKFSDLIKQSQSRSDFFRKVGTPARGGKFKTLNDRIKKLNLDISHFKSASEITYENTKLSKEQVLEKCATDSKISSSSLKKLLLREGILKNICSECGQGPTWNNKPLILQLDHIDGNSMNNELINLRILCPHCHSQTDTFSGKNRERLKNIKSPPKKTTQRKTKINWPNNHELQKLLFELPMIQIAKKLGISDVAVSKRAQKLGLSRPTHGFWRINR